jgi:hypothetical protein
MNFMIPFNRQDFLCLMAPLLFSSQANRTLCWEGMVRYVRITVEAFRDDATQRWPIAPIATKYGHVDMWGRKVYRFHSAASYTPFSSVRCSHFLPNCAIPLKA